MLAYHWRLFAAGGVAANMATAQWRVRARCAVVGDRRHLTACAAAAHRVCFKRAVLLARRLRLPLNIEREWRNSSARHHQ